jgi:hypothetical protein
LLEFCKFFQNASSFCDDFIVKGKHTGTGINFILDMHKRMKSPVGRVKHHFSKMTN